MRDLFYFILLSSISFNAISQIKSQARQKEIILKLNIDKKDKCLLNKTTIASVEEILNDYNSISQNKIFPYQQNKLLNNKASSKIDLSTIYQISYSADIDLNDLLQRLQKDKNVEYAELAPINKLIYTPSDSQNNQQWYLDAIKAYDAWDINQGDTSIVIAIVDTGTDIDHEDLSDNVYKNYNDPINGLDDDGDGYIDNYYGWDVAMNDNNIRPESHAGSNHGTNCAGIASASTDNLFGISGVGFKSKLMTVKIDNPAGQLIGAYQGVVYAADQGADIINLSWGSYSYSNFGKDIIDYAASTGAIILAGAGNGPFTGPNTGTGVEDKFYPAAYENAIAVGATHEQDTVKQSSNYGYWLGIFAPGERMWTTFSADRYGRNGGTSMAAPVVAGCAAIIKSHFPSFGSKQIEHKLYNSSDFIETQNDPKYQDKLGAGRVNLFRALTENNLPGIGFEKIQFTDNNDNNFQNGDTLRISGYFKNWLADASNVNARIEVLDQTFELIDDNLNLGSIANLDSVDNSNNPFLIVVKNINDFNQEVYFRLIIADGVYERIQYFSTILRKNILTISNKDITISLGSSGTIGYNEDRSLGEGLKYISNVSQLYEGSFIIGNSSSYVANKFRGNPGPSDDFKVKNPIKLINSTISDQQSLAVYTDENLSIIPKIEIRQSNYFFEDETVKDAIVFSYDIKNISASKIENLYAGIIIDWDLNNYLTNKVMNDDQRKMGVSFSSDSTLFAGIRALNHSDKVKHYAIDNTLSGSGGVNLNDNDGFSDQDKFTVISTNRLAAGVDSTNGSDILDALSIGPFDIETDSFYNVSFAIILSDSLNSLNTTSDSIYILFDDLSISVGEVSKRERNLFNIYPNPAVNELNIQLKEIINERIMLNILDVNGRVLLNREINSLNNYDIFKLDLSSLKTGVYLIRINGNSIQFENKFVVLAD